MPYTLTHLQQLESEAIHIIREVAAEFQNPVMLYSIGKDSGAMLHLARKAFLPGRIPFPLLHVDTQWKFQDMYRFRERMDAQFGTLIGYANGWPGYIATREACVEGGYGADAYSGDPPGLSRTCLPPAAGEMILDTLLELAVEVKE